MQPILVSVFSLTIYRAICLHLWLEETLQFFFSLLPSTPSYISELKVSVYITTCVPFVLRHSILLMKIRVKISRPVNGFHRDEVWILEQLGVD